MKASTPANETPGIVVAIEGSTLRLVATDIGRQDADLLIQDLGNDHIDSAFFPVDKDRARIVLETLNSSQCLHNFLA